MTDDEAKKLIKVTANILIETILDIIQNDSHHWSKRPCQSCRTISGIIGKSFGCYKYQEQANVTPKD